MKILLFLVLLFGCLWLWRNVTRAATSAPPRDRRGGMSVAEARAVLGLAEHADDEAVIEAHRRLMQRVHPDKGGSAHLAQQLNEAKRVLLRNA